MPRNKITMLLLVLTLSFAKISASAQTKVLDLRGMTLTVSDSRTAQVFHIVDQLSQWDGACHQQYVRWANRTLKLSRDDHEALKKHADLRRARGWGHGFEQAFYVEDPIEAAAVRAVENHLISADEAAAEKDILLRFAPILSELLAQKAPQVAAFRKRLYAEVKELTPVIGKLVRFSEAKETINVPLFLVPNPEEWNGGGGFNGGRLVVEVQAQPDPLPTLFHECLHALLWRHKEAIRVAAESVGLGWEDLNEGIAHAFAPGLTGSAEESDLLAETLVQNLLNGPSASNRKYMAALLIRPLLRSALDRQVTFSAFLPKAVAQLKKYSWR
jgi:hypothetical protein